MNHRDTCTQAAGIPTLGIQRDGFLTTLIAATYRWPPRIRLGTAAANSLVEAVSVIPRGITPRLQAAPLAEDDTPSRICIALNEVNDPNVGHSADPYPHSTNQVIRGRP
jgi:hypothetical protein